MTPDLPAVRLLLHTYSFRFAFWHAPGFDVVAFLDRAAREGYAGVGLNVNGPRYRFLGGDEPAHVDRIAGELAARGLDLDIETSGTDPAHLAALGELAARLGARHVRTYLRHAGPRREVLARTVADLSAAAPRADALGIPILLENHEELTGGEVAQVLAAVDHPGVGALFDYGNSMMLGEEPLEALEAMLPWTRKAHLKDHVVLAPGGPGDPGARIAGVPIGRGSVPVVELTRRLLAGGVTRIAFENVWSYTCPLHPREDGRPRAPLGAGTFAIAAPDDPAVFLDDVLGEAARDPARVVALEEAAYLDGRARLDAAFAAAGIRTIDAREERGREGSRP